MSTTYYCYREKYFCGETEAGGGKNKILCANWIARATILVEYVQLIGSCNSHSARRTVLAGMMRVQGIPLDVNELLT